MNRLPLAAALLILAALFAALAVILARPRLREPVATRDSGTWDSWTVRADNAFDEPWGDL